MLSPQSRRPSLFVLAGLLATAIVAVAACGEPKPATQPPNGSEGGEPASSAVPTAAPSSTETAPATSTTTTSAAASAEPMLGLGCRLPTPKKSEDACKVDADCGVSDPCHAQACVAKSKAHPPDKSTVCTRRMDCASADANSCGCLDGVCALIPGN